VAAREGRLFNDLMAAREGRLFNDLMAAKERERRLFLAQNAPHAQQQLAQDAPHAASVASEQEIVASLPLNHEIVASALPLVFLPRSWILHSEFFCRLSLFNSVAVLSLPPCSPSSFSLSLSLTISLSFLPLNGLLASLLLTNKLSPLLRPLL
jgi:hypothetical protein